MKRAIWKIIGRTGFWVGWPVLYIYLWRSKRTRALIVHEGKILLVKGWPGSGKWVLPGGGLHRGEKPLSGVIREVQEEVGITLEPSQVKHLKTITYKDRGIGFHYDCFIVRLKTEPGITKHRLEIVEAAWIKPESLSAKNAGKDVLEALTAWVER